MQREVIITNDFMSMWYYPQAKIVHHQFHQYMFGEPFRECLLKGAELMETHQATKWLSDDRKTSAVHPDDSAWAQQVWVPRVIAAGWKHWAVVLPHKVVGQMNMRELLAMYGKLGVQGELFSNPDEAMLWLTRQA